MKSIQRTYPIQHFQRTVSTTTELKSHPFYLKEYGYSNERKFSVGNTNNYSDYIFLYIIDGVMRFTKNHNTQYLHPDNIIVSSCHTPLVFTKTSRDCEYFYIIVSGSHIKKYYNMIRTSSSVLRSTPLSQLQDYFIELMNMDYRDSEEITMKGGLLIHNILYELHQISIGVSNTKKLTPVQDTVVSQALTYIKNNYQNDLTVDNICNEVSFSKYYFCKIFKEHMGITVHQYVNEFRINKSKELLSYSKLSITAIANSVGFKTQLTYSRAFERATHMTPSEYRRNF